MSGPISNRDVPPEPAGEVATPPVVEVTDSHEAVVGGHRVRRALPRRGRRTVGAWCFADHIGPTAVTEHHGLDVGPHPHIGLQTVTWLLEGEVLHRDSLGSEQVIRPGQLNLMTAGAGVAHAEERTGRYRGELHGIQLWVALPEATRHGAAAFEHHAKLPRVDLDAGGVGTVLVGEWGGVASPARRDTDHVGIDLALEPGRSVLPLAPRAEHALVVLAGEVRVDASTIGPGHLAYLGTGRSEVALETRQSTRALLLGGLPFEAPVLMWWNYVARSRDEVAAAHAAWQGQGDRFGPVASELARIGGPSVPW